MGKSILVVDSPEASLRPLVQTLGELGYLPTVMHVGDDPVNHFSKHEYELVFLNQQGIDAKKLCAGIRHTAEGAITPVIFVGSPQDPIKSPADALGAGGDYYFALPLDMTRVLAKVQTYVGPGSAAPSKLELPQAPSFGEAPSRSSASKALAGASDAVLAKIANREAELGRLAEAARQRSQDEERERQRAAEEAQQARQKAEQEAQRVAEAQRAAEESERRKAAERAVLKAAEVARQRQAEEEAERQAADTRTRRDDEATLRRLAAEQEQQRAHREVVRRAQQEARQAAEAEAAAEAAAAEAAEAEASAAAAPPDPGYGDGEDAYDDEAYAEDDEADTSVGAQMTLPPEDAELAYDDEEYGTAEEEEEIDDDDRFAIDDEEEGLENEGLPEDEEEEEEAAQNDATEPGGVGSAAPEPAPQAPANRPRDHAAAAYAAVEAEQDDEPPTQPEIRRVFEPAQAAAGRGHRERPRGGAGIGSPEGSGNTPNRGTAHEDAGAPRGAADRPEAAVSRTPSPGRGTRRPDAGAPGAAAGHPDAAAAHTPSPGRRAPDAAGPRGPAARARQAHDAESQGAAGTSPANAGRRAAAAADPRGAEASPQRYDAEDQGASPRRSPPPGRRAPPAAGAEDAPAPQHRPARSSAQAAAGAADAASTRRQQEEPRGGPVANGAGTGRVSRPSAGRQADAAGNNQPRSTAGRSGESPRSGPDTDAARRGQAGRRDAQLQGRQDRPDTAAMPAREPIVESPKEALGRGRPEPRRSVQEPGLPVSETETARPIKPLEPEAGSLSPQFDMADLLVQAFRQAITGRLELARGEERRSLFFEAGVPVDAISDQPFDRIEEYLYREGKITQAQYQGARLKRLQSARQVGAYLVSSGSLKPEELFSAVRGHLEEQVITCFEWETGTYRYVPQTAREADRILLDLDPRALIMEGIRRKYLLPRLVARIGSPSSLVAVTGHAGADLAALRLGAGEQAVARLLDGQRNLEDVVFSGGLEPLRVYHVVHALVSLGAAQVLVRGLEGLRTPDANSDAIDRGRIADKLNQVRDADYFQIVGVPRTATAYEIERACAHADQTFAAERFSAAVQQELQPQLSEIAEVLADAKEVLADTGKREAYARHLP